MSNVAGHQQRQINLHNQPEQRAAVYARGLLDFIGDGLDGLAHQEGAHGRGKEGQHGAQQRVGQPKRGDGAVVGQDQHIRGDHDLREEQHKQRVFAIEIQPRKGIARHGDGNELAQQHAADDDKGVRIIGCPGSSVPDAGKIIQRRPRQMKQIPMTSRPKVFALPFLSLSNRQ